MDEIEFATFFKLLFFLKYFLKEFQRLGKHFPPKCLNALFQRINPSRYMLLTEALV